MIVEQDLLGKIYAIYNIPNGVQHDIVELPNGNFLLTSEDYPSETNQDFIYEIDRKTGYIVRSIDLKNYLDKTRPREINFGAEDWLHLNSISVDPGDQSILISGRTQSAVIKLSYPEMKIQWILGPHDNWPQKFQPYLLTPQGDNFEWQWSQHDATILSENKVNGDEIMDVLLFDNGNYRSFDESSAIPPADSYSRIVHYRINETKRTVEQVWEYGKERGSEIYSSSRGSAYLLANGNFFGTWAEIIKDKNGAPITERVASGTDTTKMIEIDPATNQVVFEANLEKTTSYRAFRANLYDGYAQDDSNLSSKINDDTVFNLGKWIISTLQPVKKNLDNMESWFKVAAKDTLNSSGILQYL